VIATLDPNDLQGNILRGYRSGLNLVRYVILEVVDRGAARGFLGAAVTGGSAGVPTITREITWAEPPPFCFNIGVTHTGLRALGVAEDALATFPTEFIQGMTQRALKLGDFGDSAPVKWPAPFDQPARVHLVATIYADTDTTLDRLEAQVAKAFNVLGVLNGRNLADNKVFFGYVDSISQPRFKKIDDPAQANADEPIDPLGTVLLGYPNRLDDLMFRVPTPTQLGFNGTFNAFRVLAQDVFGFEAYLDRAAEQLDELLPGAKMDDLISPAALQNFSGGLTRIGALREVVAAQMCGRWRNGVPYSASPETPWPHPPVSLTNFEYSRASRCPAGAHVRRVNPRGGQIVQRIANYTRRLVRRSMVYGPDFDPARPDESERGLLGNFIGASLGAQFEAVMCDWLNLGLQDPNITGSNDPLLGANTPETSWFDLSLRNGGTVRLRGLPRFVTTRGGAYTFLPSIPAIDYLSKLRS